MKTHLNALVLCIGCTVLGHSASAQTALTWADFGTNVRAKTDTPLRAIAMSERVGDVALDSMDIKDGSAQIVGRLTNKNGSGWSTLGMEFGRSANTLTSSMSTYQNMRIRLSAPQASTVRIRLKGTDPKLQKTGCYPVMLQQIGTVPTDYIIPLASFEVERYCAGEGATPETTLPDLVAVEVTVNAPSDAPIRFAVGRIDFLRTHAALPQTDNRVERGAEWKLAWSEEFDAPGSKPPDASRWLVQRTLQRAAEGKPPSARELLHDGQGHLSMQLPAADSIGSLRLLSKPSGVMLYGRVEVRFKPPASRAVNARIALQGAPLTDLPWPDAGEIVLAEVNAAQRHITVGLIGPDLLEGDALTAIPIDDGFASKFHTATLEWEPGHLRWLLDDVVVKDIQREQLPASAQPTFDQWPYLLQFGVESASSANDAIPTSKSPNGLALQVDSVRMYKRADLASAAAERLAIWQEQNVTQYIPNERPQQSKQQVKAAATQPAQPTRQVVCNRDNKYGLLMCH